MDKSLSKHDTEQIMETVNQFISPKAANAKENLMSNYETTSNTNEIN